MLFLVVAMLAPAHTHVNNSGKTHARQFVRIFAGQPLSSIGEKGETFILDTALLREAIRLSIEKMEANEGGPFGAVIVQRGIVVGRGWNRVTSTNDPTAHAEVVAIRDACSRLKTYVLAGCEIYSSCEPCPLCLAAIYWSRLDCICYAASASDAAEAGFDDLRFYAELAKAPADRSIPVQQALGQEARLAFQRWNQKKDRIPY
jgi:tRNA(Arg) A34 adenosine deaminase TadA